MTVDLHRMRPAELLAAVAGLLLAVSLFLPWYEFSGVREDAWNALTVRRSRRRWRRSERSRCVRDRDAALARVPLAIAVAHGDARRRRGGGRRGARDAPPAGASERCYGLWLGLAGSIGVLVAACLSLRDERPFWGVPVAR